MKKAKFFFITNILIFNIVIGQTTKDKFYGTWEETHRDYVYFKTNMKYKFSQPEEKVYSGQKIAFSKDTLYAFNTFFSETLIFPIEWEEKKIETDTLDLEGNLDELLRAKGSIYTAITIKKYFFNGYKNTFKQYSFFLFLDNSIAFLEDFSLHYFKKINSKNVGNWKMNQYGQKIIEGTCFGQFSILREESKSLIITYIPQNKGINYFSAKKIQIQKSIQDQTTTKIKSNVDRDIKIITFQLSDNWSELRFSIGSSLNPTDSKWEVRYKFVDRIAKVNVLKTNIFQKPLIKESKEYLIKGDEVEVLEEKGNWLRIRYYGTKTIEGWIKKSDVE